MLDIKELRQAPQEMQERLASKDPGANVKEILTLDEQVRALKTEAEGLKAKRNAASKQIAELKKAKKDASTSIEAMGALGSEIKALEEKLTSLEKDLFDKLSWLPNLPFETTPIGKSSEDNVCIRSGGEKPHFSFKPKNHLEISDQLGLFDFKRSAKITGSGWSLYTGLGARLEWALLQYMVNYQIEAGFDMRLVPHLVKPETMYGCAQLPKFADQLFRVKDEDYDLYLIPTSEAALGGLYSDEILDMSQMPQNLFSYTPCFRREAGAAGISERGLIRTHQFNKVEMFAFALPEQSDETFDHMVSVAEGILQSLNLHYRVMHLVTGDMSFSAAKTFDLEVWLPGQDRYYECSSVSHCSDFQARRSKTRFRRSPTDSPEFVHTLNGSGLATSRLMVAFLETHQKEDGSISIPKVLQPYLQGLDTIPAERL